MSIEMKVIAGVVVMAFFLLFIVLWNIHNDLKGLKKIDFRFERIVDTLSSMKNDTRYCLNSIDTQISYLGRDINEIYESMFKNSDVSIYRKENITSVEEYAEDKRIITRCHDAFKNKDSLSPDQARRILEILQEDN